MYCTGLKQLPLPFVQAYFWHPILHVCNEPRTTILATMQTLILVLAAQHMGAGSVQKNRERGITSTLVSI